MNQRKRKISQLKKNCLEKNKKESGTKKELTKKRKRNEKIIIQRIKNQKRKVIRN